MGTITDFLVRTGKYRDLNLTYSAYDHGVSRQNFMFTSYAHADRERVIKEINHLTLNGINVWYDQGIRAGKNLDEEIMSALKKCSCFVLFLTRKSITRTWVLKEAEYAKKFNRNIITVYLDKIPQDNIPQSIKSLTADTVCHINLHKGCTNITEERRKLVDSLTSYGCHETVQANVDRMKAAANKTNILFEEVANQREVARKGMLKTAFISVAAVIAAAFVVNFFINNPISFGNGNSNDGVSPGTQEVSTPDIYTGVDYTPDEEVTETRTFGPPQFDSYDASSVYYKDKYNKCSVEDAFDDKITTAWQDGTDGYGEGEWVRARAFDDQMISRIIILNGYHNPNDSSSLFEQNTRAKKITVIYDGGEQSFTLKDTRDTQVLEFDEPIITSSIQIVFDSVYKGSKYHELCITDILFE